jgi:hypothetical protein
MRRPIERTVLVIVLALASASSLPAQERPYKDGPVINVSEVRTKPGQTDAYLRYIFGDYAKLMEAQKAAGIIVAWGVYTNQTRNPEEADVILTTVYANMAAFDNLEARTDPIVQRVLTWTPAQAQQASAQRESMRSLVGSRLLRELQPR